MPLKDRDEYDDYMKQYMRERRAKEREQRAKQQTDAKKKLKHNLDLGMEYDITIDNEGNIRRVAVKKKEDEILGCNVWHED